MTRSHPGIAALVRQVTDRPSEALSGRNPAVRQLAARGARALGPVLAAMSGPYPAGRHPRDVVEALAAVLEAMAKEDPAPLIDVLERGAAPPDPQLWLLTCALQYAPAGRVLDPLARALKHPNVSVRWAAAHALVRLRSRKAVGPLRGALRDRSAEVKGVVVAAMLANKVFRTADAVEPLRRIAGSGTIKRQWPGLWRNARAVLAKLEEAGAGRKS